MGSPGFAAAPEIVGPEGGLFKRVEPLKGEAPVESSAITKLEDGTLVLDRRGAFAEAWTMFLLRWPPTSPCLKTIRRVHPIV